MTNNRFDDFMGNPLEQIDGLITQAKALTNKPATWHIQVYQEHLGLLRKVKIVGPISNGESNGLDQADFNSKMSNDVINSYQQ